MSLLKRYAHRIVEDGDCLRWTGALANGYPCARIDGKVTSVRRAVWQEIHGQIPAGRMLYPACGLCACLNPAHSRLVDRSEHMHLTVASGRYSGPVRAAKIASAKRAGPQAKLSDADVVAMRASGEGPVAAGQRYGISASRASLILRGLAWRDYTSPWQGLGS